MKDNNKYSKLCFAFLIIASFYSKAFSIWPPHIFGKPRYPDLKNLLPFSNEELEIIKVNGIYSAFLEQEGKSVFYFNQDKLDSIKWITWNDNPEPYTRYIFNYDTLGRLILSHGFWIFEEEEVKISYTPEGFIQNYYYRTETYNRKWKKEDDYGFNYNLKLIDFTSEYLCYKDSFYSDQTSLYYYDHNFEILKIVHDEVVDSIYEVHDSTEKWKRVYVRRFKNQPKFEKYFEQYYCIDLLLKEVCIYGPSYNYSEGESWIYTYDSKGMLIEINKSNGNPYYLKRETIKYSYNDLGLLEKTIKIYNYPPGQYYNRLNKHPYEENYYYFTSVPPIRPMRKKYRHEMQ